MSKKITTMKKRIFSITLIMTLVFTMVPMTSFASSKPKKVTITSASVVDEEVIVKWKSVKCKGYQIYYDEGTGWDSEYITKSPYKSSVYYYNDSGRFKVRAYNIVKQKQYYNSKTKKWIAKKPAKKYWKGKKTRKISKKVFGSFSSVKTLKIEVSQEEEEESPDEEEKDIDNPGEGSGGGGDGGSTGGGDESESTPASQAQINEIKSAANTFTSKWYTPLQNHYRNILSDEEKYTNRTELIQRWLYDSMCDLLRTSVTGAPSRNTSYKLNILIDNEFGMGSGVAECKNSDFSDDYYISVSSEILREAILKNGSTYYTFTEFKNGCNNGTCGEASTIFNSIKFLDEDSHCLPYGSDRIKLIANKDFGQLSDAMKIYALNQSSYFKNWNVDGSNGRLYHDTTNGFHMIYDMDKIGNTRRTNKMSSDLKKVLINNTSKTYSIESSDVSYFIELLNELYNNTATGVCDDFSTYEYIYLKALGLDVWKNINTEMNHAWTVLKVNNSSEKTLWIPFDYGVGTTVMNDADNNSYKIYFSGIPGAINYKNFTVSDFK